MPSWAMIASAASMICSRRSWATSESPGGEAPNTHGRSGAVSGVAGRSSLSEKLTTPHGVRARREEYRPIGLGRWEDCRPVGLMTSMPARDFTPHIGHSPGGPAHCPDCEVGFNPGHQFGLTDTGRKTLKPGTSVAR